jgi:putative ABC transport system substrate-binding protein
VSGVSRRRFVVGVGLGAARAVALAASGPAVQARAAATPSRQVPAGRPRLGFLDAGPRGIGGPVPAFLDRMREYGWVEGETVEIEWRFAEGRAERLPELAVDLARLPLDVLVAGGGLLPAQAAAQANRTIPIVMTNAYDVVETGLVTNLARPEGNVTGVLSILDRLGGERVLHFHTAYPGLRRVAVLWNPLSASAARTHEQTEGLATGLGWELRPHRVRVPDDLDPAFAAIQREDVDGLLTLMDPLVLGQRARLIAFAARARLPAMYPDRPFAADGGLLAVGQSGPSLYRRAASYVDALLRGARPSDLPVVQPDEGYFVVNVATARAQGLAAQPAAIVQATELLF